MPQDVHSTSDRRLIELKNQVQHLMEAHLAPNQPIQVNKITSSCEIFSGPHDTQYCMENPEQDFVDYASSRTDETRDAKITRFEADFKQHQSEITNKLDTLLKAFNDRMTGALPSDTVKNPKLNPNSTSSARSYLTGDPQCSFYSFKSVNAIQTCFRSTANIQENQLQVNTLMVNEIETPKPKEPDESLKDEFADLHLNLPVLEVLAHVLIYDALLDKYIVGLELGKNGLGDSKPFDTLADLGSCVNLIPLNLFKKLNIGLLEEAKDVLGLADGTNGHGKRTYFPLISKKRIFATASAVIDCKKAKIGVGEGLIRSIFGVKELDFGDETVPYWTTIGKCKLYKSRTSEDGIGARPPYYAKKDFLNNYAPREWDIVKDAEVNPFKDVLVFRKMVEFLGAIPINLKGNMWESKSLVENNIDWNKLPKEGDDKMLKRCEDTKLALNWEKSHFMVKEGIVLGHKISRKGIEVDKAKVDVISKLPHPTTVKGIRSFLGHAGFYRRFIKDFSKISRPMTHLLEKNTPFIFSEDCILAFQTLKKKLTEAPILIAPNWDAFTF
ncbi:hypothetical protein Tco_0939578 [Tanacetum coccineum]|uniref:Reverse transcriptase domain-containing protein n=1 Tax=Tanacetum coccineum TaxID=301880 RepID=A0ABQ5DLD0_9ASTR